MELIYRELAEYMANNIEDFEVRVQIALKRIDRNRCPLQMADYSLYSEMVDLVEEWANDNDFEDIDEIDIESILFN